MAENLASPSASDALEQNLGRLAKKPGVKAAIALDRKSGAIIKTAGILVSLRTTQPASTPQHTHQPMGSFSSEANESPPNEKQGAEELAALVWSFAGSAGALVQQLDAEDEVKLLRLRTKKQELVIFPDPKYLMIVVHDTLPA